MCRLFHAHGPGSEPDLSNLRRGLSTSRASEGRVSFGSHVIEAGTLRGFFSVPPPSCIRRKRKGCVTRAHLKAASAVSSRSHRAITRSVLLLFESSCSMRKGSSAILFFYPSVRTGGLRRPSGLSVSKLPHRLALISAKPRHSLNPALRLFGVVPMWYLSKGDSRLLTSR